MKTAVGVYSTHGDAVHAIKVLKDNGYPAEKLSILGKVNEAANELETKDEKLMKVAGTEVGIGAIAGTTAGILTGIGLFAIPGLGFLFGAGALAGAIAGFDIGLIGGGVVSALTIPGMKTDAAKKYEKELDAGRFLVIAQGTEEEIKRAEEILKGHGTHTVLDMH